MKNNTLSISLITALCIMLSGSCTHEEKITTSLTDTLLIDAEYLKETKTRIVNDDPLLEKAYKKLIEKADKALLGGPFSVTHKKLLPPSGDKHDYASYSRYWWPNPDKADGLPYIRRDGETYPGSQSPKESDRPRIGDFGKNTETLGLAYYLTGNKKYAKKAAELLRVWFLNEETKMNPNVNHAQCRLGHNTGTKTGILDGRLMVNALEGSLLIKGSSELSDAEYKGLKSWATEYFEWITTNEMALDEAKANNNHGSFYDAQAIYFALYSDNKIAAKNIADQFADKRIYKQIEPDGTMPEELARTRSLFYCVYNLHAMFLVAHLAEKVEVDLWHVEKNNAGLKKALDYLTPYADPQKIWPLQTISEMDRMEILPLLKMGQRAYPDGNYLNEQKKLPSDQLMLDQSQLAFPLMR